MFLFLRFPKMVEIANPRLIILYVFLQACTLAVLTWWFLSQRFYEKQVDIGSFISANMFVSDSDLSSTPFREQVRQLGQTLCRRTGQYDYWHDPQGHNTFSNVTCAMPCNPKNPNPNCATTHDGYMTKGDSEVFVPTSRSRIFVSPSGRMTRRNQFIMTADAMTIHIGYFFDIPLYRPSGTPGVQRYVGSSKTDMTTIIQDQRGATVREIPPGQPIHFRVPELLALAGHEGLLDRPHLASDPNKRPGSSQEPPIGRISGFELLVNIRCEGEVGEFSYGIRSCSLTVQKTENPWTFERVLNSFGGAAEEKVIFYNGVRIRMRAEGRARHWDIGELISKVTTCLVLLTLPRRFVMALCTFMLGHLSAIYRQAVYDRFNLKDAIAGMSARLLVWNASFVDLVDKELSGGIQGISKSRMHERLISLLKTRHSELDAGEIDRLCQFTHQAMLSLNTRPGSLQPLSSLEGGIREYTSELGLRFTEKPGKSQSEIEKDIINSDRFSVACTSNENLNFDAVVKLFDKERKRWFLERLFTPKAFKEILAVVGEKKDEDTDSDITIELDPDLQSPTAKPSTISLTGSKKLDRAPSVTTSSNPVSSAGKSEAHSEGFADPNAAFTLEQERDLRKNMHKKVLQLLKDHAEMQIVQKDIKRTVEDHRHHFDSRHREHLSKVMAASEESHKRIEDAQTHWIQKHEQTQAKTLVLEKALWEKSMEIEEKMTDVQRSLEEKLAGLEAWLRETIHAQAAQAAVPHLNLSDLPDPKPPLEPGLELPVGSPSNASMKQEQSPLNSGHLRALSRDSAPSDLGAAERSPSKGSVRFRAKDELQEAPQQPGIPGREPVGPISREGPREPAAEAALAAQEPSSGFPWRPLFLATLSRPR